ARARAGGGCAADLCAHHQARRRHGRRTKDHSVTMRRTQAVASDPDDPAREADAIRGRLDERLAQRGMTLTELSAHVDVTVVNLSVLKNGRARAIRLSTMARLCAALGCPPSGALTHHPPPGSRSSGADPYGL